MTRLLQVVIAHHRLSGSSGSKGDDAMQVDPAPSEVPSVHTFLAACVSYSTTQATLRIAIRQHLSEAADLVVILEILDRWITSTSSGPLKLLPTNVSKNPKGVFIPKPNQSRRTDVPPLDKVRCFLYAWASSLS